MNAYKLLGRILKYGKNLLLYTQRYPPFWVTPVQVVAYTVHMGGAAYLK